MTSFDTIIVGAGSAGCVLAARLSEDSARRVLLLESGPDHREGDLPDALRFLSRPVKWPYEWDDSVHSSGDRVLSYLRGRGTGGSSAINGGVAMRAEPPDFETWPAGWQWDDLLPSFRRLERDLDFGDAPWHGDEGPIPIVRWSRTEWVPLQTAFHDACLKQGFAACDDHNEPGTTGVGPIPMNRIERERVSSARAYLEPARQRRNLVVRGDAHVRRVLLDGVRAIGVELAEGQILRSGEVILSAGVVQNPPLLWRSGVGPAERIRALGIEPRIELPAVGDHLSDHMVVTFTTPISRDVVPEGAPAIQTILRATAPGSDRLHDLHLTPYAQPSETGGIQLAISVSLQMPVGTGSVAASGADASLPPRIDWPFTELPENVSRLRAGWRFATQIADESGLGADREELQRWLDIGDDELDLHIAHHHQAFYHGVGTCRMGDRDAPDCVVDPDCRVRGVAGLSIVDASIAPIVPRSNTNILVTAMAERALEYLR